MIRARAASFVVLALLVAAATATRLVSCDRASGRPLASPSGEAARGPDQIRRDGNHLVGSGSAYLTQHAHNPVDWYPWGPEALERAVRLDRPIFLSIGYVSCHWCHVMEQEVFEHDDVAVFLNEHFVSIKVDREERPDLDDVYMQAVLSMSGSGGWPMTVLLTPSLRPFFGGSYLPHDRFLKTVQRASERFRTSRNEVESESGEVYRSIAEAPPQGDLHPVDPEQVRAIARRSLANVDSRWGGFAGRTKFPTPARWGFLLHAYRKWGDPEIAAALRLTLDAMARGGIHDHIGGGFFRYSTEPTWTIPHFEKMLYDNAQLAALYLEAGAALGDERYRDVGTDILRFLLRDMRSPQGGFGASFDADSGGDDAGDSATTAAARAQHGRKKEGASYLWTPAELRTVAGDGDGGVLARLLGVTDAGNFDGSNVPTMRGDPADAPVWTTWRPALLQARRRRPQPDFDPKMVTAWNGLAIHALVLGHAATGEPRFLAAAEQTADALWSSNRLSSGELARASNGGHPAGGGVLDDHAFLAMGMLDLFLATSKPDYLDRAVALVDSVIAWFVSPSGGWFLSSASEQEPMGRRMALTDSVEPSGNAVMIQTLERLAALTGRSDLEQAAAQALRGYGGAIQQSGLEMAGWLDGALLAAGPLYELVIAGAEGETGTVALRGTSERLLAPWVVEAHIPVAGASPDLLRSVPPLEGKTGRDGTATAYVCVKGSCKEPSSDPARLRSALLVGWMH